VVLSGVSDEGGIVRGLIPVGATYLVRFISLDPERVEINHEIVVPKEGYLDLDLRLTYLPSESRTFILHGVFFETGKAALKEESFARLSDLLEYMTAKESVVIELAGHTDSMGSGAWNQKLSEARAVEVKRYLVSRGIDARRINAVGYGETRPVATNETAEGRRENRRTVVTVLQ
jgi:outer membrane protein OmpA-like peptidoglycan-associated protein